MKIKEIKENKKQFLPLLLLADEQEDMIDRYINKGTMYVLDDDGVKCECVITDEGKGVLEIKNIATEPEYQGKGYGKALIDFVATTYKGKYSILQVGTGDSPLTIPFCRTDTKGALLYRVIPICALGETEHPGHLNVRGVLRHYVPSKGLHPLRLESGYPHKAKGATTFITPFAFVTVLRTPR